MSLLQRIKNKLSHSKLQQEIEAEIQSHVEMRIADNIASGMSPEAARRDALVRALRKSHRNARASNRRRRRDGLGPLVRDLIYATRQLRRTPAFTVTALFTLILAIGANVVVFSVLNALVLRPLDVPQSAGLYNVAHKETGFDNQSYPDYIDFKARNKTFRDMAVYRIQSAGLPVGTAAYQSWYYRVSGNYFDMLGILPAQGRLFHATDEHGLQSAPYIVLSNDFWRSRFALRLRDRRSQGVHQ